MYVQLLVCLSDYLLDNAKIFKKCHYSQDFPKKRMNTMQKNGDFVKFYGKLSNFVSKTLFVWMMQIRWNGCAVTSA